MSKHIVLLGNPVSGKTNFIACSLAYIQKHYKEKVSLMGVDLFFLNSINSVGEKLPEGEWLDKTKDLNAFAFKIKETKRRLFSFATKVTVHDWMGEAFDALDCHNYIHSNSLKGTNQQNTDSYHKKFPEVCAQWEKNTQPSLLKPFLDDISLRADIIAIFIDSPSLFFDPQKRKIRASLAGLQNILQHDSRHFRKRLKFSFIVTKSDMLIDVDQFCITNISKFINSKKIQDHLEKEYDTFFSFLKAKKYEYHVWPVSCVPNLQHRKVSLRNGIVPSEEWTIDDMGYSMGVSRAIELYSWIGEQLL